MHLMSTRTYKQIKIKCPILATAQHWASMSLVGEWWRVEFELTPGLHQGWSQRLCFVPCFLILHFIFQIFQACQHPHPKCNTDAFCQSPPLLFIFPFIALPLPSPAPLTSRHIFVVLCKPLKAILTLAFFCLSLSLLFFLKPFFSFCSLFLHHFLNHHLPPFRRTSAPFRGKLITLPNQNTAC